MSKIKRFSIRAMAKAMIADKTPKAIGDLVVYHRNPQTLDPTKEVVSSCAVGGAALKLGVAPHDLAHALQGIDRDGVPTYRFDSTFDRDLYTTIYRHNDATAKAKAEIGQLILDNADRKTLGTMIELPVVD